MRNKLIGKKVKIDKKCVCAVLHHTLNGIVIDTRENVIDGLIYVIKTAKPWGYSHQLEPSTTIGLTDKQFTVIN